MTAFGASFCGLFAALWIESKTATLQAFFGRRSVSPRPIPCPPPVTRRPFPVKPFNADLPCRLSFLDVPGSRVQSWAEPFFCRANPAVNTFAAQ